MCAVYIGTFLKSIIPQEHNTTEHTKYKNLVHKYKHKTKKYSRQGSNLYLPLRRGSFYPLNYESIQFDYIKFLCIMQTHLHIIHKMIVPNLHILLKDRTACTVGIIASILFGLLEMKYTNYDLLF